MSHQDELRTRLLAHHRQIDEQLAALESAVRADAREDMRSHFQVFERNLLNHMNWEEMYLLPEYRSAHPEAAARIRTEHEEYRTILGRMGIELDLHLLRAETFGAFAEAIRQHAEREEHLYGWSDEILEGPKRDSILRQFRRLLH